MLGISSIGIHIPRLRMPTYLIHSPRSKYSNDDKAVANFDEDVITMAVSAATDCLREDTREGIDRLYLASTTAPFVEKSAAAVTAQALYLGEKVLSADFGGSLRASATALRSAMDAVAAGSARRVLVIASDMRTAEPRSSLEVNLGDAAVALLVEQEGRLVFEGDVAISRQLFDVWREDGATTLRSWENRFVIEHGYKAGVSAAMQQFLAQRKISLEQIHQFACYAPDVRNHGALGRQLGFKSSQIVTSLGGRVGNCGTASVPLMLAQALQKQQEGERLVTAFYGDGAHVMSWIASGEVSCYGGSLDQQIDQRIGMNSYRHYLQCRGLDVIQLPVNPADGISATVSYRDQGADLSFLAAHCEQCDTEQFPPARVCYHCKQRDSFRLVPLANRRGHIASYTKDYFFPSPAPPLVAGVCEVEGGARVYLQMADYYDEPLSTGLPVEFVFRRIHRTGGKPAYFWKSRLVGKDWTGSDIAEVGL